MKDQEECHFDMSELVECMKRMHAYLYMCETFTNHNKNTLCVTNNWLECCMLILMEYHVNTNAIFCSVRPSLNTT